MSTKPYSKDLRTKVMHYISEGNSQKKATEVFKIHKNTISRWCVRYKEEGTFEAKPRLGFQSKVNLKELEEYVKNNSDIKLLSVGIKFNITSSQAGRILKKLGYSYKKKRLPMWKRTERSEINI